MLLRMENRQEGKLDENGGDTTGVVDFIQLFMVTKFSAYKDFIEP